MGKTVDQVAEDLFNERYNGYHDPSWDEVSEACRRRFRIEARKAISFDLTVLKSLTPLYDVE
jgi:hypothetical protein